MWWLILALSYVWDLLLSIVSAYRVARIRRLAREMQIEEEAEVKREVALLRREIQALEEMEELAGDGHLALNATKLVMLERLRLRADRIAHLGVRRRDQDEER